MPTLVIQDQHKSYSSNQFGINTSMADPTPENKPSDYQYISDTINLSLRRSHDDRKTRWDNIEVAPGVYNFTGMDEWVFRNPGSILIWTVYQTPKFYATDPEGVGAYGNRGQNTPPVDKQKLYDFVYTTLKRYRDIGITIDYVEPLNEVNVRAFWNGSLQDMAECVLACKKAVNDASPGTLLIMPSLTNLEPGAVYTADNQNPADYFFAMIEADDGDGGKLLDHCDVLNFHLYGHPKNMLARIGTAKAIRDDAGLDGMPIWNTEVNYRRTTESEAYMKKIYIRALVLPVIMGMPTCLYKYGNKGDVGSGYSMMATPQAYDGLNSVVADILRYGIDRAAVETTSGALTLRINNIPTQY